MFSNMLNEVHELLSQEITELLVRTTASSTHGLSKTFRLVRFQVKNYRLCALVRSKSLIERHEYYGIYFLLIFLI